MPVGAAMVLANPSVNSLDADFHAVPTIHITVDDADKVWSYLADAGNGATAKFVLGNITNKVTPLPEVAEFSSRGPAIANEADLLKPDIAAPGVSVLAAMSGLRRSPRWRTPDLARRTPRPGAAGSPCWYVAQHERRRGVLAGVRQVDHTLWRVVHGDVDVGTAWKSASRLFSSGWRGPSPPLRHGRPRRSWRRGRTHRGCRRRCAVHWPGRASRVRTGWRRPGRAPRGDVDESTSGSGTAPGDRGADDLLAVAQHQGVLEV